MDIVIDFDGTVVSHEFPKMGNDIGSVPVLRKLVAKGHNLILFTMRSNIDDPQRENKYFEIIPQGGKYLDDAVKWFADHGIPLYGIQKNPTQHTWTKSPKAYGQVIIDDAALGCPLRIDESISTRAFVDWVQLEKLLYSNRIL